MSAELLLDTSGLICLLDRSQHHHETCAKFFAGWTGSVVVTDAVITEATHLLGRVRSGATACLDFVLAGGATLVPSTKASLGRCRQLMSKYADLPMDYADATLVALAEELETTAVFTLDRKGFGVYRIHGKKSFRILPRVSD